LDKRTYRVGETATVAVRSKAPDATVLVTVEGERLYEVRVLRLKNGMAQWQFPVSPDLLPNAYVTASLVWRKQFTEQSEPLRFALDAYRLQVSVRSDKEVYEPREKALLTVQVRDAQGKPVKAEVSLAVVDEAIYAIREDNPEQVFQAFYAERLNRIVTRFSFPLLIWQGDKGATETARRFFPDTALWLPHVVTDEKGQARLPLTVPDTLTQWRITAIAHTPPHLHRFRYRPLSVQQTVWRALVRPPRRHSRRYLPCERNCTQWNDAPRNVRSAPTP